MMTMKDSGVGGNVARNQYEVFFCIHRKGAVIVTADNPDAAADYVEKLPIEKLEEQVTEIEISTDQIEDALTGDIYEPTYEDDDE